MTQYPDYKYRPKKRKLVKRTGKKAPSDRDRLAEAINPKLITGVTGKATYLSNGPSYMQLSRSESLLNTPDDSPRSSPNFGSADSGCWKYLGLDGIARHQQHRPQPSMLQVSTSSGGGGGVEELLTRFGGLPTPELSPFDAPSFKFPPFVGPFSDLYRPMMLKQPQPQSLHQQPVPSSHVVAPDVSYCTQVNVTTSTGHHDDWLPPIATPQLTLRDLITSPPCKGIPSFKRASPEPSSSLPPHLQPPQQNGQGEIPPTDSNGSWHVSGSPCQTILIGQGLPILQDFMQATSKPNCVDQNGSEVLFGEPGRLPQVMAPDCKSSDETDSHLERGNTCAIGPYDIKMEVSTDLHFEELICEAVPASNHAVVSAASCSERFYQTAQTHCFFENRNHIVVGEQVSDTDFLTYLDCGEFDQYFGQQREGLALSTSGGDYHGDSPVYTKKQLNSPADCFGNDLAGIQFSEPSVSTASFVWLDTMPTRATNLPHHEACDSYCSRETTVEIADIKDNFQTQGDAVCSQGSTISPRFIIDNFADCSNRNGEILHPTNQIGFQDADELIDCLDLEIPESSTKAIDCLLATTQVATGVPQQPIHLQTPKEEFQPMDFDTVRLDTPKSEESAADRDNMGWPGELADYRAYCDSTSDFYGMVFDDSTTFVDLQSLY